MAITSKRLCHGTLTDSNATLYTAPSGAGAKTIIKGLALCNAGAVAVTVTLKLAGTAIYSEHSLEAHESITIGQLDQILEAGELIEGLASAAASIKYYITGKELT